MLKQEGRSKRGHIVVEEKEEKKLHRRSTFPPKHAVAPPHSHTQPRSPCFSFSLLWAHFQHQHRRGRTFPTLPDLDKSCEMDDATPAHRHLTHRFRLRNFYDRKVGETFTTIIFVEGTNMTRKMVSNGSNKELWSWAIKRTFRAANANWITKIWTERLAQHIKSLPDPPSEFVTLRVRL